MFDSPLLRRKLAWPISVATLATFVLAWFIPAGGLFLSLATTFLGILLTVGYVDLVLREHDSAQWAGAIVRILKRLENFATVGSTQFRIAFGFGPDIYDERMMWSSDDRLRRAEVARVARHVLRPVAKQRLVGLDTAGWKKLCDQLQLTWNSADRLIELYGARLQPEAIAALIDMQDRMRAILDTYTTFPDVLGVPDLEVKPNRLGESSIPLKRALESRCADDVSAVLDLTIEILAYVDRKSSKASAA